MGPKVAAGVAVKPQRIGHVAAITAISRPQFQFLSVSLLSFCYFNCNAYFIDVKCRLLVVSFIVVCFGYFFGFSVAVWLYEK